MLARPRLFRPVAAVLLAAGLLAATAGCGEATPGAASPSAASLLPVWDDKQHQLFDDNIDPAALGLSMDTPSPRLDPYLRERAQASDVVGRVRVQTVTVDTLGEQLTYHLGLEVARPTLAEPRVPDSAFELSIRSTHPAFGVVKSFDARLRGKTFIGFLRKFQGSDGEAELHFHLSADTEAVARAVKDAVALRELSGS